MSFDELKNKAVIEWSLWGAVKKRWATFVAGLVCGILFALLGKAVF